MLLLFKENSLVHLYGKYIILVFLYKESQMD